MNTLLPKPLTTDILAHFSDSEHFKTHADVGRYTLTGNGRCALILPTQHFDLPYTTDLGDEWLDTLAKPRTVLGYISMDRLRSFLLETAREVLSEDVPQCLYAERMKDADDTCILVGSLAIPYWEIDEAWRMLFAIGAETVRLSAIQGFGSFLFVEPMVGGEAVATVVVSVSRRRDGFTRILHLPTTSDRLSNDADGFAILAPTNFALLKQERTTADAIRPSTRKVYAVTMVQYATVHVYASSEKEACDLAALYVDDDDFNDTYEIGSVDDNPSYDEDTDVYGAEGLLDPEDYMEEEE